MVGYGAGDSGRAIHRGQDADVVSGSHATVRAYDPHEHRLAVQRLVGFHIEAERIITGKIAHGQVVHMHVVTSLDNLGGKTDDLPIATKGLACINATYGDLVTGGYWLAYGHAFLFKDFTRYQRPTGDQYIVQRIEAQDGGCTGFHDQFHRKLSGYQAWEVAGQQAAPYLCCCTIRAPGCCCLMRPLD
ncbi:hypothetical protein D3C87_1426250 [compost metagenome]